MDARRTNRGKGLRGRPGSGKVTWSDVYNDFKQRYPSMARVAPDFHPYNYATIKLYFVDGRRMLYNYDTKKLTPGG